VTQATPITRAAEGVAPITVILSIARIASGFAGINSAMQTTAAGASGFPALRRKVFIEFQKEFVKAGIREQSLVQSGLSPSLSLVKETKKPLRIALIKIFEGSFDITIDFFDQNPGKNHQLPRPCSTDPLFYEFHLAPQDRNAYKDSKFLLPMNDATIARAFMSRHLGGIH
jgi:hypothetical protein